MDSAIAAAVDYCIKSEVMAEYLQEKRKEVVSMLGFEYDEDLARKARDEEVREESFEKGRDEGREESKIEMVKNLLTTNLSLKEIARVVGWSEDKILKFAQ